MVNFNGRIGHIDVPISGNYDFNNQRSNQIGADESIFNFDKSERTSLNVNNSKQYYEEREFQRYESPPKPRSDDTSIFNEEENIFAKHFATTNNISEDEAKFVLEKMYGMTDNNIFNF